MAGRKGRAVASLVAVLIVGGILGGCSKEYNDKRGKGDAPVQGRMGGNTAAEVFNMPDEFGNLATKCVGHGFRAYVTTNASGPSNVEIVPDKTCGRTRDRASGRAGEDTPAEVYNFPDGFGNLATKCIGPGRRGYVTTKSVHQEDDETVVIPSNAVVVDDPGCRAGR